MITLVNRYLEKVFWLQEYRSIILMSVYLYSEQNLRRFTLFGPKKNTVQNIVYIQYIAYNYIYVYRRTKSMGLILIF